jgi:hypothetical protein
MDPFRLENNREGLLRLRQLLEINILGEEAMAEIDLWLAGQWF